MLNYDVTGIQDKPLLTKVILPVIEKIDREEKLAKLHKLKNHQDIEFAEVGVGDGIE
ncbi:MAG TPA: hypothetical protein PLH07_02735 [Sulfurovum sp.]|jgi:hypothetical protein|nr:hypothetical protein [Sulfurovum sp.]HQS71967.1 hypothetical protein [Sulfurovum sp.]HQS77231.1 hypothetical protein [Sulfurovum sp.]HQT28197.1 hypothetical protein [Sulfurovum sp.]